MQDGAEMVAACAPGGLGVEEVVRLGDNLSRKEWGEGGEGGGCVLEDQWAGEVWIAGGDFVEVVAFVAADVDEEWDMRFRACEEAGLEGVVVEP